MFGRPSGAAVADADPDGRERKSNNKTGSSNEAWKLWKSKRQQGFKFVVLQFYRDSTIHFSSFLQLFVEIVLV